MRKLFLLLLCLSTVLSCISCNDITADETAKQTDEQTRYETTDTTQFHPDTTQQTDNEPIDVAEFMERYKNEVK